MSHQPTISAADVSARRAAVSRAEAARKANPDGKEGATRSARAGRIAAGAAIGSAAIAGALLFAGKIDGATPKRVWDKVKPPRTPWGSSSKD